MHRHFKLTCGAELEQSGVRFRLWAPKLEEVALVLEEQQVLPMSPAGDGWFELTTDAAHPGTRYRFRGGGIDFPDPISRSQPEDVAGPSEVIDPAVHDWQDEGWQGRPWPETILYELHVGTFSKSGTFDGVIEHLHHLTSLGVNAIEIMPVAEFPGARNWGYDGVLPYAVEASYGGPTGLKRLVEACHQRGISVILDVVYNHFGPEGNYLNAYAPDFFTDKHHTPWGVGLNFDDVGREHVRRFFIENALYWLTEFHMDGLRLDAVHGIKDDSEPDIVLELGRAVRAAIPDRPIHLILENDQNRASVLGYKSGGPGPYSAQWNDDFHHAAWVLITGRTDEYYVDYQTDPSCALGRVLAEGFFFQGERSRYRHNQRRGEPSAGLPPSAFVNFIQNHDQVGNHAYGWRMSHFAPVAAMRAIAAILMLSPPVPMIWQGEEWNSGQPFPFFCDFEGELADAVRKGRIEEFGSFAEFRSPQARALIPDPLALETFETAVLCWESIARPERARHLEYYRRLIDIRRTRILPFLVEAPGGRGRFECLGGRSLLVEWQLHRIRLSLLTNLSPEVELLEDIPETAGECIFATADQLPEGLPAWYVGVSIAS